MNKLNPFQHSVPYNDKKLRKVHSNACEILHQLFQMNIFCTRKIVIQIAFKYWKYYL